MKPKPQSKMPKLEEIVIPEVEVPRCNHVFQFVEAGECKCRKCGMGLIGVIDIINGRPI
jgi:hypothetical protein